jgi:Asp-tRNA(Asn)/Glu-tRNA(Gln) amidotransferase C subunit
MSRNAKLQSRKGRRAKKNTQDPQVISLSVPEEKRFQFFTDLNKPTGIYATSIYDFLDTLKKVDLESLEFHVERNDFSRWLREVVGDNSLADDFEKQHALDMSGEKIRSNLVEITEKRCKEMSNALKMTP